MNFLNSVITRTKGYTEILNGVMANRLPVEANGLSSVHKAVLISALLRQTEKKAVLITPDEAEAARLNEDLEALGLRTLLFPSRDYFLGSLVAASKEYEHKRIDTLSKLLDGAFELLILPAEAATQYTAPPEKLNKSRIKISLGDTVKQNELISTLLLAGYTRSELVEGAGQFALRGGILDIFPTNKKEPLRIEFWGDEVDSIHHARCKAQVVDADGILHAVKGLRLVLFILKCLAYIEAEFVIADGKQRLIRQRNQLRSHVEMLFRHKVKQVAGVHQHGAALVGKPAGLLVVVQRAAGRVLLKSFGAALGKLPLAHIVALIRQRNMRVGDVQQLKGR